ncbi:MAG TPA: DUF3237 domain-containing protein [Lachnospiraceae bacterium]|nr:DUF3237 domain-containing protein [Lachnospiraceae bacterium]
MDKLRKEILTISVHVTRIDKVEGSTGEAIMIYFTGHADCEAFKGSIINEGVDTQKNYYGMNKMLSARYMLEGIDSKGEACHLFIENNASIPLEEEGKIQTVPKIITDSKELAWLETADLTGEIEFVNGDLVIHIFNESGGK